MVLADMQAQKVLCGKVPATFCAAVRVDFIVMNFEVFEGGEGEDFVVRGAGAFHCCPGARGFL